jgi:hypothetical protein
MNTEPLWSVEADTVNLLFGDGLAAAMLWL